jgi:3D (Asp-Asp-Asp) domain-containing protein
VLGQAHPPLARILGIAVAVFAMTASPALARPNPEAGTSALRAENARLAEKTRSAVLDLYSLDSRLSAAHLRLATVRAELGSLRRERATLGHELTLARTGEQTSERQLADRLRQLYDQGDVSPIEVVFGASSISDAMTQLDNIQHVASLNDAVLAELRTAKTRLKTTSQRVATRTIELDAALQTAAATEASLQATRDSRASYIASLASRRDLNSAQIARLESQATAAETKSVALTGSVPAAAVAEPVAATALTATTSFPGDRTLTVGITGYALPGTTATGIPVGWGVAAVDPNVIPLGTHIWVPGYGEAVAADVGSAIVGTRVDLWFPTVAQAESWGFRTLTIALH